MKAAVSDSKKSPLSSSLFKGSKDCTVIVIVGCTVAEANSFQGSITEIFISRLFHIFLIDCFEING